MNIKLWDSLKRILRIKTLQCQDYANINDLTSWISLSLWHYKMKLMNKYNAINIIESLIWDILFAVNKWKYFIIEKSIFVHEIVI